MCPREGVRDVGSAYLQLCIVAMQYCKADGTDTERENGNGSRHESYYSTGQLGIGKAAPVWRSWAAWAQDRCAGHAKVRVTHRTP